MIIMQNKKSPKIELYLDNGELFHSFYLPSKEYQKIEEIVENKSQYNSVEDFCCCAVKELVIEEEKNTILDEEAIEVISKALFYDKKEWKEIDPAYFGM